MVNAREREKVIALGFSPTDLNEGIILLLDGKSYVGAEAIHHLALLSTSNSVFNRINHLIFKWHFLSILLYPMLKMGRRVYLFVVGKSLIE
jgi:hypothetical protein